MKSSHYESIWIKHIFYKYHYVRNGDVILLKALLKRRINADLSSNIDVLPHPTPTSS